MSDNQIIIKCVDPQCQVSGDHRSIKCIVVVADPQCQVSGDQRCTAAGEGPDHAGTDGRGEETGRHDGDRPGQRHTHGGGDPAQDPTGAPHWSQEDHGPDRRE